MRTTITDSTDIKKPRAAVYLTRIFGALGLFLYGLWCFRVFAHAL